MLKIVNKNVVYKIKNDFDFFESQNIDNKLRYDEKLLKKIRFLPTSKINPNRIDKDYVKLLIKSGFYYFDYLPEEIKRDKDIIEYAIKNKSVFILTYMDDAIKNNKHYLEKCLEINNFIAFNNLTDEIIKDEDFLIYLMKKNKNFCIFPALPKEIRHNNFRLQKVALEQNLTNAIMIEIPQTIGKKLHGNTKISIIKKYIADVERKGA